MGTVALIAFPGVEHVCAHQRFADPVIRCDDVRYSVKTKELDAYLTLPFCVACNHAQVSRIILTLRTQCSWPVLTYIVLNRLVRKVLRGQSDQAVTWQVKRLKHTRYLKELEWIKKAQIDMKAIRRLLSQQALP